MLRVGLSGGIGSGKSTVSGALAELGAVVVDADLLAREVVAPGTPGLAAVRARFGEGVIAADGSLDRPALGAVVFGDEQARRDLEAITHPLIAARTRELVAAAPPDAVLVHDVPLLVEKQMGAAYHLVVIVAVAEQERLRRLVELRGMAAEAALTRIRAQAGDEARRRAADVWLPNDGSLADLRSRVGQLYAGRLVPFERNVRERLASRRPDRLTVSAPDPSWPAQADRLAARLRRALGDLALAVDHVGSTAIPGMPAKDVIDLQVVVPSLAAVDDPAVGHALDDAGFPAYRDGPSFEHDHDHDHGPSAPAGPTLAKRLRGHADPARVAHVHLRPADSPAVRLALLLRDWVSDQPAVHAEYADVERRPAAAGLATADHAQAKELWFAAAFARAEEWARHTGWQPPPVEPPRP